jgi:hypothetical protein
MSPDEPTAARKSWRRAPALHFVVLGGLLFGARPFLFPPEPVAPRALERPPIVITAAQVAQLRAEFVRQSGTQPTADDEQSLIQQAIDDELLYQEALVRGLDRGDRSIRWRMIQKMHFLSNEEGAEEGESPESDQALYTQALALGLDRDDVVIRRLLSQKMRLLAGQWAVTEPPTDEELRDYLRHHEDRYSQPARASLSHVFFSRENRPETLLDDADRLLATLQASSTPPEEAIQHGDIFALGHRFRSKSQHDLQKILGADFAAAVMSGRPGTWLGPVRSPYGLHLVWIDALDPERVSDFAEVRTQIEQSVRSEKREKGFQDLLEELRETYEIRIERDAPQPEDPQAREDS